MDKKETQKKEKRSTTTNDEQRARVASDAQRAMSNDETTLRTSDGQVDGASHPVRQTRPVVAYPVANFGLFRRRKERQLGRMNEGGFLPPILLSLSLFHAFFLSVFLSSSVALTYWR